ncbi:flagellin [Trujillonella endophytica]|uniref:Flagellin n=1 Tax=Trujillonella endophytica TaxID=673521 RepID=A0A1H8SIQ4_9ACTN|nr:flagellin [Trujillella endophytica]SEO78063.1 flagellar hook-associated protein 3 FlgL [Trujillella endophytica]
MRVTQRAIAQTSLLGLNQNLDRVSKLQQQLTSGRLISAPSDSPTGTNRAMQVRQDTSAVTQQARNISDGTGWLASSDSSLETMLTQVRRVRDLAVQGLNGGAMSDASRTAIATELASLRESMIGVANQTVNGRPVFGGATAGKAAYDADGTFVGVPVADPASGIPVGQLRRVSDTEQIRVDITGLEAFGDPADGRDLFALVGDLAAHVRTPAGAGDLDTDLADLDVAINRLLTAAADIGSRSARMESAKQINLDRQLTLKSQLSEVEEIDLPRTIMELNLTKVGYEAALSATAKAIQPSLVDYLR